MADPNEHDEHEVDFVPEAPPEEPAHAQAAEASPASEPPSAHEPSRASEPPPHATSSSPPPREGHNREERRSRLEGLLRESMRRAIEKGLEAGVGTLTRADSAIRGVVDEAKLPREVLGYVFSQVEDGKNVVVGAVAKEVREFLESTDLAAELLRALTSLSFEIKTEIRFIPNEKGEMKPRVKSRVAPKRVSRRGAEGSDEDASDEELDDDRHARRPSARRSRGEG